MSTWSTVSKVLNLSISSSHVACYDTTLLLISICSILFLTELNAEPQVQTTISILATLPWSFKLIFGFLSDVVPINGQHRKPYLTLGALIYSVSYIYYALVAEQNVLTLAMATFVGTMGMIMMDVMADTMCVERSRFEPEEIRGQMQSSYYSIRFGGSLLVLNFSTAYVKITLAST